MMRGFLCAVFLLAMTAWHAYAGSAVIGYLSAARGGGSVPVFAHLKELEEGMRRGDPLSAMSANKICDAIDGTLVEIHEDTRFYLYPFGDFMEVRILNWDCRPDTGWVEIKNIRKRLP